MMASSLLQQLHNLFVAQFTAVFDFGVFDGGEQQSNGVAAHVIAIAQGFFQVLLQTFFQAHCFPRMLSLYDGVVVAQPGGHPILRPPSTCTCR